MRERLQKRMAAVLLLVLCVSVMTMPALGVEEDEIPVGTIIDIFDEPVPLAPPAGLEDGMADEPDASAPQAAVPVTGDPALLPGIFSALSGAGLAGLAFAGRKRRDAV